MFLVSFHICTQHVIDQRNAFIICCWPFILICVYFIIVAALTVLKAVCCDVTLALIVAARVYLVLAG